ncbi:MAG: LysR family transcriptional regulator [Deltaproteobacteria bacterium]|nr:LysR family transcriptional regulator [Deltaproteobacteria bacterium]
MHADDTIVHLDQPQPGDPVTLTQLEYLIAVDDHRHFGKAARACHVTQPTLSMQLQKLEDELGVIVFDRSRSPALPTQDGARILEQARQVLRESRRLEEVARRTRDELAGDFRLAVIPTISTYLLPLFLESFTHDYPSVNLVLEETKTDDIIERLKDGEVDAGLMATPLHDDELVERAVFYEPFHLFVSSDHALANKGSVTQRDLDLDEIWLLDKGNCFREQVLQICAEREGTSEMHGQIRFESGNLETLKNMVLSSGGYTVLPHLAVGQLSGAQRKLVRHFEPPIPTREVSLVCRRSVLGARVVDAIEEEILRVLPRELRDADADGFAVMEFTR